MRLVLLRYACDVTATWLTYNATHTNDQKKKKKKLQKCRNEWENKYRWLEKVTDNSNKAKCTSCTHFHTFTVAMESFRGIRNSCSVCIWFSRLFATLVDHHHICAIVLSEGAKLNTMQRNSKPWLSGGCHFPAWHKNLVECQVLYTFVVFVLSRFRDGVKWVVLRTKLGLKFFKIINK